VQLFTSAALLAAVPIATATARAFVASDANSSKMELAITLPTVVCGPVLGEDVSPSILIIKKLMDGSMPGRPNLYFPYVDVRDWHPYISSLWQNLKQRDNAS
jgi:hypothetical protein